MSGVVHRHPHITPARRHREERAAGLTARPAYGTGLRAVSGALLLALTSGLAAFLSNVTSGIESIIQFGIGAAIALVAAYLLLGIVSPLVVARIEDAVPAPLPGRRSTVLGVLGGLGVASLTMTSVLLLVFIAPWLGVIFTVFTLVVGLLLPVVMQRRLVDEHVGDRGGEPAVLYVEGDPANLQDLQTHVSTIRDSDTALLARDAGGVRVDGGIFSVFEATWDSPIMSGIVAQQTGVAITDENLDRIPDSREQIEALIGVGSNIGVPLDAERSILTPDDVTTAIALNDAEQDQTFFEFGLVNSRNQESVSDARKLLEPIAASISADLGGSFVQVTGSPFVREASLDATNNALQTSLPIALVLCLLVSTLFLRSIRYGLASIVPIMMVVTWLYAFMELAGYSINIVTATIAAVSIGIGIDFAIHFIARYDEELERAGDRYDAVRAAGEGTGVALLASAFSSSVGFGILAFAPMPLFAAYGLLTALMIAMALVATLLVLPSILVLITESNHVDHEGPSGPTPVLSSKPQLTH